MHSLIDRLRRTNREQRKLLVSVGANFLTRVPGAVGFLWLLPLLHVGLGTEGYANLLSALSLGVATGFLSGGVALIGRRLIGEAYARGDRQAEADSFVTMSLANTIVVGLALVTVVLYCRFDGHDSTFAIIAILTGGGFLFNGMDSVRPAYNEHYATAFLLFSFQIVSYIIAFLVPAVRHHAIFGSLILLSPYSFASVISFALMMRHRAYLLRGRPVAIWVMLRDGTTIAVADSFLFATLSLSVVWLQSTANPDTAAWFATIVRLFQTLLMPIAMVLLPLSSYIRIRWNGKSIAQQRTFTKATLVLGIGYGFAAAIVLYIVSRLYVSRFLHLPVPDDVSIFLFFGAIIAYRGYSNIAYMVMEETRHLSMWTTATTGLAVAIGVVASFNHLQPIDAIDVYAMVAGLSLIGVICWNAGRFIYPKLRRAMAQ